MKKSVSLCAACLLVLSGCVGGPNRESSAPVAATPSATPLVVETPCPVTTPPPSATPVPVQTAAPTETPLLLESPAVTETPDGVWDGDPATLTLNDFPTQLVSSAGDVTENGAPLSLIAQLPDQDTWLYGVYREGEDERVILRVGTQWQSFPIPFLTPQSLFPILAYGDFDGDMDMELAINPYAGGGTGSSLWDLYIVEFGDTWTAHKFKPADYQAIVEQSVLCSYDAATNLASLQAGDSTLDVDLTALGYETPGGAVSSGLGGYVNFGIQGDSISASFSIGLWAPEIPPAALQNAATLEATVVYTGSAFGLDDLRLSSAS